MEGRKDRQLVLRLPQKLLEAVEAHRAELQRRAPYERITMAHAVRSLLARAIEAEAKPSPTRRR
jgi:hypothetical protein